MMPVSELRLDPLVPVPDHVLVEHADELVHRDAREAPLVEELLLEPAEEPLRGRVVGRTAFRAHGAVRLLSSQMRIHSGHR